MSVGIRPGVKSVRDQRGKPPVEPTQACQCVYSIDVHGAASTDALSATSSESESWVNLVLDPDQSVQHHRARLVQVQGVRLHLGLARGLVGVPSVYIESLDPRVLVHLGLVLGARLVGWDRWARRRSSLSRGSYGLFSMLDGGGHSTAEDLGRKAP